ncbi:hypothetical protein MLD38_016875 [Melastoma candidum]|uniref:Uncharacterized protein n=1 Tax=Melastoma candidum TaxID=119954 RepID=A0ACB9QRX4_9MYRT|nr:hypothetical protein MLD38_016875 [Melastoma candidum]
MGSDLWLSRCSRFFMWLEGSDIMDHFLLLCRVVGGLVHQFLLFVFYLSSLQDAVALEMDFHSSQTNSNTILADAPSAGILFPIEISPAIIPQYPIPNDSLPPMYPTFPTTYEPVLTGKCPVNFSRISDLLSKTASDCSQPLAPLVGNAICCPQFSSLAHIFQGYFGGESDKLIVPNSVAGDCFSDIMGILSSRGANVTLPALCSIKSSNLTGGSCPVTDVSPFEKMVNSSKLLDACGTVDPLKECCRPICQNAVLEAALLISGRSPASDNNDVPQESSRTDILNDCKGIVYSYMARKLSSDAANTAFRILSACKVNKVCPLDFKQPSEVIAACKKTGVSSPSCCGSLNAYIRGIQKQMLITNKQAIICATLFGSMLRKGGVMANVYEHCDVDLKDFSIQAYGQQGCLLRSLPSDVIFDNTTGYSFTCDLTDNIVAPWPSSSSVTSISLCAPEMSLPALPNSQTMKNKGDWGTRLDFIVPIFSFFILTAMLYLRDVVMDEVDYGAIATAELPDVTDMEHMGYPRSPKFRCTPAIQEPLDDFCRTGSGGPVVIPKDAIGTSSNVHRTVIIYGDCTSKY